MYVCICVCVCVCVRECLGDRERGKRETDEVRTPHPHTPFRSFVQDPVVRMCLDAVQKASARVVCARLQTTGRRSPSMCSVSAPRPFLVLCRREKLCSIATSLRACRHVPPTQHRWATRARTVQTNATMAARAHCRRSVPPTRASSKLLSALGSLWGL